MVNQRHLLGIDPLSHDDVRALLERAKHYFDEGRRGERKFATLRGKTVVNLFFEASTRTRSSFEIAGKRLGADVINVSVATSSVSKGETLLDTVRNLEAMAADVLVVRHNASGAPHFVATHTHVSVVNAGDGAHEHPTQALLDALTIDHHKGTLSGLKVAIVGDITHSRVARSDALLLSRAGSEVRLAGLGTMLPRGIASLGAGVSVCRRIEEAVEGADVVIMLRIQNERFGAAMMASTREYSRTFGLGPRVLGLARPDALVMHPGPVNRGVELDPALADGARSAILHQVEAGVAVRMAVLEHVLWAAPGETSAAPPRKTSAFPPGAPS